MFDKIYSQKKRDKGIIDFHDIEHFALQILTETDENGEFLFDEEGKIYLLILLLNIERSFTRYL